MANDTKSGTGPVAQEGSYPPAIPPYTQPLGAAYPPGYPIYYAQPPDSGHGENANGNAPGPQYMIPFPAAPGMIYPYPPPPGQGFTQYPQSTPAAANGQRPKRKQVKMACTNCANACKRCNETRPCERCIKYGIQSTCRDGVRKERQKGIKRGPYKRKNKNASTTDSFVAGNDDSEWQPPNGTPQAPTGGQPPPPIQPIPHYPPPPEGFYPYFYPPPPGFIPPGHDGQSPPEGGGNGASHHPPMVSYYSLAPPGFFPHYATSVAPGPFPPPPNGTPVAMVEPAEASRNATQSAETEGQTNSATTSGKKRSRPGKAGEAKSKKQKAGATTQESPTSGRVAGGSDHTSDRGAHSSEHDD